MLEKIIFEIILYTISAFIIGWFIYFMFNLKKIRRNMTIRDKRNKIIKGIFYNDKVQFNDKFYGKGEGIVLDKEWLHDIDYPSWYMFKLKVINGKAKGKTITIHENDLILPKINKLKKLGLYKEEIE